MMKKSFDIKEKKSKTPIENKFKSDAQEKNSGNI